MIRSLAILALVITAVAPPVAGREYNIPGFGEGNAVSLNQEYYLGRAWLMSFRRQAPIYDDSLVQDYVETLIYRLVETSQLQERRLEILLVENRTINAFAVPGGVVGIHTGLIAKAETEAQFSSVLTHELAHLSQRHFSRGVETQKQSSAAAMAGLLGGLVMIAAGAGDAGMGAVMGGQAAAMDSQLRYSRQYEQEADRVGMQNQVAAGLDPGGAAGMFQVMQAESRFYGSRPPEFLMTHPVTESRIADTKNRAASYPKKIYQDNPEFQLMRARVELSFIEEDKAAIDHFERWRKEDRKHAVAAQYGLVLAYTRSGDFDRARELLRPMREFAPNNIPYLIAETDIDTASGQYDAAIARLQKRLALVPGNHPLTMHLAEAYFRAGDFDRADTLLSRHVRRHPGDAHLWYLLAEAQGKAGNRLGLHQSRAEYFALHGAMDQAVQQLKLALPLATNQITVERIYTRIDYFEAVGKALRNFG